MKQTRMKPEARKDEILATALVIASMTHYTKVTREQIAKKVGVSGPAVQYHFHTMCQLRKQLMRAAIKQECLPVIAQGYVANDPCVLRAPEDLRRRAIESIGI